MQVCHNKQISSLIQQIHHAEYEHLADLDVFFFTGLASPPLSLAELSAECFGRHFSRE